MPEAGAALEADGVAPNLGIWKEGLVSEVDGAAPNFGIWNAGFGALAGSDGAALAFTWKGEAEAAGAELIAVEKVAFSGEAARAGC